MDDVNSQPPAGIAAVPHPVFELTYSQKDITNDIAPYVISVEYIDYLGGKSDELEVELEDVDGRWRDAWYPGKGDTLSLRLGYADAPLLPCGVFEIDEIEISDPPSVVLIRGLATGIKKAVRTRQSRPFERTTLAAIAGRIAKRNHLTLVGEIRDIRIDRVTQFQERDVEFLARLAREHGYAFKIRDSKLIFTELASLRDRDPVKELRPTDLSRVRFRDKISGVYKDAKAKYHDPKTKKLVVYGVKHDQVTVVGESAAPAKERKSGVSSSGDTLKIGSRATSAGAARSQAHAALARANLEQTTGSFSTMGDTRLVAGNTFSLLEYGRLSGTYLIDSARHRLQRDSGYTTMLELKRVTTQPKKVKAGTKKAPDKGLKVYGLKDGKVQVVGTSAVEKKK